MSRQALSSSRRRRRRHSRGLTASGGRSLPFQPPPGRQAPLFAAAAPGSRSLARAGAVFSAAGESNERTTGPVGPFAVGFPAGLPAGGSPPPGASPLGRPPSL